MPVSSKVFKSVITEKFVKYRMFAFSAFLSLIDWLYFYLFSFCTRSLFLDR